MRCAISACRSSRTAGAGGADSLGAGASGSLAVQSGALVDRSCAGWARSSLAGSDSCHAGADLLLDQSCVGAWVSSATGGADHSCVGGAGSGSDGALGSGAENPGCATADLFSAGGNASITPSFTRPERRVRVCIFPRRSCSATAATSRSPLTARSARQRSGVNVTAPWSAAFSESRKRMRSSGIELRMFVMRSRASAARFRSETRSPPSRFASGADSQGVNSNSAWEIAKMAPRAFSPPSPSMTAATSRPLAKPSAPTFESPRTCSSPVFDVPARSPMTDSSGKSLVEPRRVTATLPRSAYRRRGAS